MKKWIQAARLRTLPLSLSGIIFGSFYALHIKRLGVVEDTSFNWAVFILAIITTIEYQVLSNFANDYGDGVKGTDANRVGEKRLVAAGEISKKQMKQAIYATAGASFICTILLVFLAFKDKNPFYTTLFFALGILSIISAIKYTVGRSAYGYKGFGDVFVFLFFGWVSTLGSSFLFTKSFIGLLVLPASAIGMLSAGVLNMNNMRDEVSDRISNKNTLVVTIGGKNAKRYHYFLIVTAMVLLLLFAYFSKFERYQYSFAIGFIPLLAHLRTVYLTKNHQLLDSQLKVLALSTFFISVLLSLILVV